VEPVEPVDPVEPVEPVEPDGSVLRGIALARPRPGDPGTDYAGTFGFDVSGWVLGARLPASLEPAVCEKFIAAVLPNLVFPDDVLPWVEIAFGAAPSMAWDSIRLPPQSRTAMATVVLFF